MGLRGLFINNVKAQDSIYESGLMVFNCLQLSDKYSIEYTEINDAKRTIPLGYDFYYFNYHPSTMNWMDTSKLKGIPGLVITMVLEVLPNDPFVMCPDNHFHAYCVIDPSINIRDKRVFAFPRPLEQIIELVPYSERDIPVIGSFGFATKGKGFQHVVDAVNREFDRAIVRINIPFGDFVPESESYSRFLAKVCQERAKDHVTVEVTHDYMSKFELINWCSQNTLNCFLYDRNIPGLAATTDQAIVSGRPLSVSKNDTFRHILSYLPPYPQWSLKDSIQKSMPLVNQMKEEWSPVNFARKFEMVLEENRSKIPARTHTGSFEIPVVKNNLQDVIGRKYRKYKRLLTPQKISEYFFSKNRPSHEELI